MINDWTTKVAGAELSDRGGPNFIGHDGSYVVDIDGAKITQNGGHFVLTTKVIESTHPRIRPGESRSWIVSLSNRAGPPDVLAFTLDALQRFAPQLHQAGYLATPTLTQADLADGRILHLVVDENHSPLRGLRFSLVTQTSPQKNDRSKSFTRHTWEAMEPGEVRGLETDPNSVVIDDRQSRQPPLVAPVAPAYPVAAPLAAPAYPGGGLAAPAPVAPLAAPAPVAPLVAPAGLPAQPPQGWPAHLPWPPQ